MDRDAMGRWMLAFIGAHENGDLPETDLIVLDSIHTFLESGELESGG